jgi:putative polyhydroxyalkanoate system protein
MSEIRISRHHGMSLKKAKAAAEHFAAELAAEFDIEYAWNGNILEFQRPGVSGTISVDKKDVEIRARLGLLLLLMRSTIEREIHRFCDENFGPEAES